ncbi:histidine kinase [Planomonospora sp. ID91781]|uniref:Two-component system sensor histidine kinase n=1 Tax=Planomonospora sphaerica TaxID=161355 RepID=A0A161M8E1_9ACTN|nr:MULTISPECIES: histidine kinase [Planomonospora]MBG0821217.1 histidine kinase [Planomonospora sp. ID91781]GAT65433.1 two-component system sensor histidine kinase [Planomonospora sphaerica]
MTTNTTEEQGTGRLRRLVPAALPRRRTRSQVERLRRLTAWMLGIGIFLAWVGPLGWFANSTRPVPVLSWSLGLLGLAAFTVLQVRVIRAALEGTTAHREVAASGAVALAVLLVQDGHLLAWGLIAPAWASGAALVLNRSATLAATVVATGAGLYLMWPDAWAAFYPDQETFGGAIGGYVAASLTVPWMNRFQLWFWEVVRAAEAGKAAQAQLAVTEERLRFARDLHDLVGHSLSAIALKSEVAAKLVKSDTGRAAAEMDAVRGLAREALKEIRTAVRGYRTVDLEAELHSMTAVLEAGGIRCALEAPPDGVPEEEATLLAWVAREGTTNVLRHSSATRCRISVTVHGGTAVLEMVNDGVTGTGVRGGTGLIGLSERLAPAGGTVTAGPGRPGEFRLRATVPLEGAR